MQCFLFHLRDLTTFFFSHRQSNLKSEDVVLKQIIAGSMTVSGAFYKNKLPDRKRKLVCVLTGY